MASSLLTEEATRESAVKWNGWSIYFREILPKGKVEAMVSFFNSLPKKKKKSPELKTILIS